MKVKQLIIVLLLCTRLIFCSSQKESLKPQSSPLKFSIQIKKMDGGTYQHILMLRDDKTNRFMKRIAKIKPSHDDRCLVESEMETNVDDKEIMDWLNTFHRAEIGELYSVINKKKSSCLKFAEYNHDGMVIELPEKKEENKK